MIDRSSPLPLYAQVKRRLYAEIRMWPRDDDRFFTDQQLQEKYKVSRATIRQAMTELEEEGLVRRQQGFGTFVVRAKIEESFGVERDFSSQWAQSGHSLRVADLKIAPAPCPPRFARLLAIEPRTEVLCIERLRMSGGLRIAWDLRYLPQDVARQIPPSAFQQVSLLEALQQAVRLDQGDTQIEAALAGDEYAQRLDIAPAAPVLIRELVYFSEDGKPVFCGMSAYRADQVRYKFSAPLQTGGAIVKADVRMTPDLVPSA